MKKGAKKKVVKKTTKPKVMKEVISERCKSLKPLRWLEKQLPVGIHIIKCYHSDDHYEIYETITTKTPKKLFTPETTHRERRQLAFISIVNKEINIYDEKIYDIMKKFGTKYKYERLIKDWCEGLN